MRRMVMATIGLFATIGAAIFASQESRPEKEWKIGELVPDLTLGASDGKQYRLRDFVGKQAVVIAWFPKAFTGG